ncbi:MAG: 50S ribosomal protein L15, partial [Planctomycetota bacterium]
AQVNPQALKERGLVRNLNRPVKILGNGSLSKKLHVEAAKFSKSAEEKIRAAGGEVKIA